MHRDHARPKTLSESKAAMNKAMRGFEKRLTKRFDTFPGGEYVIIARCLKEDKRSNEIAEHVRIAGSGKLYDGALHHLKDIVNYVDQESLSEEERARMYLEKPDNAASRSKKLRAMLQHLWQLEGLPSTKHIYKAVAKGKTEGFEWWKETFPDVPFTNESIEHSNTSDQIFDIVSRKLYERLMGCSLTTGDDVEHVVEQVIPCKRHQHCTRPNGHVGACNGRTKDLDNTNTQQCQRSKRCTRGHGHLGRCDKKKKKPKPTDLNAFYTALHAETHADEPFRHFSQGEIAQFAARINTGMDHLEAYKAMGVSVTAQYEEWIRGTEGGRVWTTLKSTFPDYLEVATPPENMDRRKLKKTKPKKKLVKKRKSADTLKRKLNTSKRHKQSAMAKKLRMEKDGYYV